MNLVNPELKEFHIFTLSPREYEISCLPYGQGIELFRDNPVELAEFHLARAKAWANLIATDWDRSQEFKPRPHYYQTQSYCWWGAANAVTNCINKLKRAKRAKKKKPKKGAIT